MDNFSESRRHEAEIIYAEHQSKIFEMILNLLGDGMVHNKGEILGLNSNSISQDLQPNLILRALEDLLRTKQINQKNNWYKITPKK